MPPWAERNTGSRASTKLWIQHGAVPIMTPVRSSVAVRTGRPFSARHRVKQVISASGMATRLVATAIAATPTIVPSPRVRPGDGDSLRFRISQVKYQKTKTDTAVGIRMIEYAWAGTKKIQPAAAAAPTTFAGSMRLAFDFSLLPSSDEAATPKARTVVL